MRRARSLRPPLALWLAFVSFAGAPQAFADRNDELRTVKDLAYGEVLFYFYQDDHFAALTRLLAGLSRDVYEIVYSDRSIRNDRAGD